MLFSVIHRLVPGLEMPDMASGLLRNFQAVLFPGLEAAVHFHDGITLGGELHRGVRAHVTVLGIAVNDAHRVPAQTSERAPFFLRQIDRAGDVAFLEIFGLAHVYDDDILFFLNLVADFDGAGGESHFVSEELPRLGRVALECFSHIPLLNSNTDHNSVRPKKFATRRLSAFLGAESAREKDDKTNQQNQTKPAAADDGAAKIKPAAAEQEEKNNQYQ
jgi:hypothetical protein